MPAIKIIHLINSLDLGGAEISLYKLLSTMDKKQFNNSVIYLIGKGELRQQIESLGISVYMLKINRYFPSLAALLRLYHILRKERPDILQTWLYYPDLLGLIMGRLSGINKVIWNIRCSYMDFKYYSISGFLGVKILAFLSGFPKAVIINSQEGKIVHARIGYHPRRWEFIHNGVDLDYFKPNMNVRIRLREELGVDGTSILVGLIARYDPQKSHGNFLKAASIFLKKYQNKQKVYFILAGNRIDYYNTKLNLMIRRIGIEDNVKLLGKREDVSCVMSGLDILASSSSFGEGFPNVVAEAMACGIPCVVTDVGDSALIVGDTGRVVPPNDSFALCEALLELVKMSRDERKNLGLAARKRIEENFELSRMVLRYENLYRELAGK